jgi:proteasome beta subunit
MSEDKIERLKTGTTTVGIVYKDGVVLAAERKATMGYLVASKYAKKIMPLADYVAMTTAGAVGDAQALERYMKAEIRLYELAEERKMPVSAISYLLANILHSRRFYPYFVQLLVGGYDEKPQLFSFDPTGSIIKEDEYFSTGSGSVMALGVLEDKYKPGMTEDETVKLAVRSIKSAIERDIGSGGSGIDVCVVNKNGVKMLSDTETKNLAK